MSLTRSEIISRNPIGDRIDGFTGLYDTLSGKTPESPLTEGEEANNNNRILDFIGSLQTLPACRMLHSVRGSGMRLRPDIQRILPLLKAVRDQKPDEVIWNKVYEAVTESTPPPLPSFPQTPWLRNTSSLANSSEFRKHVDGVLKEELCDMYVDIPGFDDAFFGDIPELQTNAQAVFERCKEGEEPLFREGRLERMARVRKGGASAGLAVGGRRQDHTVL
ncbi:hypothetical protein MferCBS31731_005463 [Microsporum ferrugineum]